MDVFRIVAFGSSSTEGSGATTPGRSYPPQLATLLQQAAGSPVEVLNRGVGGDDIHAMLARLSRDVISAAPDLVIWQAGSNDPLRGVPVRDFTAGLEAGAETIAACGATLMLMEPQWSPALQQADPANSFVLAVRDVAARRHLVNVRRLDLMQEWFEAGRAVPDEVIGPDGLHMTDLGYRLLAEAVAAAIVTHVAAFRSRPLASHPVNLKRAGPRSRQVR